MALIMHVFDVFLVSALGPNRGVSVHINKNVNKGEQSDDATDLYQWATPTRALHLNTL